jgi:peptidyl-prolyl cis-trans isomerase SurA
MKSFFVFLSIFLVCTHLSAAVIDRVLAIVNSEIILESDLSSLDKKLLGSGFIDDILLAGTTREQLKSSREKKLEYLINERLLDSEVKRLNLSVTVERVEQEVRDMAKKNKMSRNDLIGAIKSQGIALSEYQDFLKTRVERQSLIEAEVTSKIRIADEDILGEYMRTHPDAKTGIYEFVLAHIYFNPKKGGVESTLERAQKVIVKLKSGESFEVLAEQNSEDPSFTQGGLLGTFKAGEFSKEFEAGVSRLSVGEYSSIVPSKSGFHILKVLSKKLVSDPQFERQKEKIRGDLTDASFQKHFKIWLEEKRTDSFIRINK